MEEIEELRERVRLLEEENARLRRSEILRNDNSCAKDENNTAVELKEADSSVETYRASPNTFQGDLKPEQIERYSRQLLLHGGFGVEGQLKLLNSSILVVGAGGIGSTGKG